MSNKSSPKQHGLVGNKRPVKTQRLKANKAKSRVGQKLRQEAIRTALVKK